MFVYNTNMAIDNIKFDSAKIVGEVNAIEKQLIPRAVRISLNRAVFDATIALKKEAQHRFNKVNSYTLRSFLYEKPEQIDKQTMRASVFISSKKRQTNRSSDYLAPQIYGGSAFRTRFPRGLENAETYIGKDSTPILKRSEIMAPVRKITPSTYSTIMGQMRGISKPKNNRYFYMGEKSTRKSGYKKGIYKRTNKKLQLMLVQINTPTFNPKRFDFFDVTKKTVESSFKKNLFKEIGR